MGYVTYTAKRSLLAGVDVGDEVTLALGFREATPSHRLQGAVNVAPTGAREAIVQRIDVTWSVSTSFHLENERGAIRQFLHSVMAAETFTVDFRGTSGAPSDPKTVRLVSDTVTERRLRAGSAAESAFAIAFDVVEV